MALPTTTEFNLFDWNGGVKISDPTQGLVASPEAEISHPFPQVASYFNLYVLLGQPGIFAVGDTITSTAGWSAEVAEVNEDEGYIRVAWQGGPVPAESDDFTSGSNTRYIDRVDGLVRLDASVGLQVSAKIEPRIPASTSLEFRIRMRDLPLEQSSNEYIFVGLLNPPTGAAGLQFSTDGIALVAAPGQPAIPLGGSRGLIVPVDMTFRIVMNAEDNRVLIYATETSQVASMGHILRYSSEIPPALPSASDQVLVALKAASANLRVDIHSLRTADSALIPNERPVARVGDDQSFQLGETARLDGRESFDPEGLPLTYRWNVLRQPSGMSIKLQDPLVAEREIFWPAAVSSVKFSAMTPGNGANGLPVRVVPEAAFDMRYDDGVVVIEYVAGVTTIADLVTAWADPAYEDVTGLLDFEYAGLDTSLLFYSAGFLAGGADGSNATNFFQPPAVGAFQIGLTVNDGTNDSVEVAHLINIIEAQYALGYVPDGDLIWRALPDFWETVSGKEPFTTDFSALIQVLTSYLLEAWQHDYAKSHATIPRFFQRRWMDYSPLLGEEALQLSGEALYPESYALTHMQTVTDVDLTARVLIMDSLGSAGDLSSYRSGDSIVLWPEWGPPKLHTIAKIRTILKDSTAVVKSGRPRVLDDPTTNFVSLGAETGDIVQIKAGPLTGRHRVMAVREKSLVLAGPPLTADEDVDYILGGILNIEEDDFAVRRLLDDGEKNGFRGDVGTDRFYLRGGATFDDEIAQHDVLAVYNPKTGDLLGTHAIKKVDVDANDDQYLMLSAPIPPYHAVSWQVLRDYTGLSVRVIGHHVFEVPTINDMEKQLSPDDAIRAKVTIGTDEYDWMGHVIAVRGQRFAARPNVYVTGGAHELWNPDIQFPSPPRPRPRPSIEATGFVIEGIWRLSRILVDPSVRRIPRLQESPGDPASPMIQTLDYLIEEDDEERFIKWHTVASGTISGVEGAILMVDGIDLVEAGVVPGATVIIPVLGGGVGPDDRWGAAKVLQVIDSTTMVVDWAEAQYQDLEGFGAAWVDPWSSFSRKSNPGTPSELPFYILSYGTYNLPPSVLWAEVTYYDNSETIENNFGIAVGFPKDALGDNELDLDYLSSVRAFWFAFWFGPTVSNIRLGEQILFGLPFSEEAGTIVSIDDDYSGTKGRIIIESDRDPKRLLTYFYPLDVDVDTNPATEAPYVVGDHIEQFAPLCTGIEIHDYLTDPSEMSFLQGPNELKKYHTFKVKVRLGATELGGETFSRALEFARKIKPVHTNVVMVGVLDPFEDTVDVSDYLSFKGTLKLEDEMYTTEDLGGGPNPDRWWLPYDVPTGKAMRSGFAHRLDFFDNVGQKPLRLWPEYSPKARHVLWLETEEDKDDFEVNDLVVCDGTPSFPYALRVIRDGPAYVLCEYLPWTFEVVVQGAMSGSVGDVVWENSPSPAWRGIVVAVAGSTVVLALDNRQSIRTPSLGLTGSAHFPAQPPDDFTDGVYVETLSTVLTRQFHEAAVGDICTKTGGNTFIIRGILNFRDCAQNFDRASEVGPEVFMDLRSCFWVGGDVAKNLIVTPAALPGPTDNELIREWLGSPPNWFAKVLRSIFAGGAQVGLQTEMVPIYEFVCASIHPAIVPGDIIMGMVDGRIWGARVHLINGLTIYAEKTTELLPTPPEDFTKDYSIGSMGVLLSVNSLTRIDPVPTDQYASSTTPGSGVVNTVTPTFGRYPQVGLGLVADDIEVFSAPVDLTYSALVEVASPSGSAFDLGEEVRVMGFPRYRARVRQKWPFALSLYGVNDWTPVLGHSLVGLDSGATATVIRTWDREEYSVPSLGPGRYFWADTMLVEGYVLAIHISSGTVPSVGQYVQDVAYSPPRWKGYVVFVDPGLTFIWVTPKGGFIRSQPVRGQNLEILPSPGAVFRVGLSSWALQWVPAAPAVDDQALCRVIVGDPTPHPKPPRKASTVVGDSEIVDAIGV